MRNRQNIVTMATATAGVIALAGGCGWPTVATSVGSGSAGSSGSATCAAASLSPEVHEGQGSAGNERYVVVLTNRGSTTCSIVGYPVLVLRDAHGQILPPAYPTGQSKTVRLSVGRSATATMTVTPSACAKPPRAATAAVSPPGSSYSTSLPVDIAVCHPTISPVMA